MPSDLQNTSFQFMLFHANSIPVFRLARFLLLVGSPAQVHGSPSYRFSPCFTGPAVFRNDSCRAVVFAHRQSSQARRPYLDHSRSLCVSTYLVLAVALALALADMQLLSSSVLLRFLLLGDCDSTPAWQCRLYRGVRVHFRQILFQPDQR
jgi:hypothetical protein